MPVNRARGEAGFTMISVVLGLTFVIALSVVAVTAVRGDLNLNRHDLDRKRAYEAAKAGVNDYVFHLHNETDYWAKCTNVKPASNAVNQVGSTAKRRPVPGNTGATYAIELLPAAGQSTYKQCSTTNPGPSMLEPSGLLKGTFRIRSTGFAGDTSVAVVATFKPATFLDYVYYTQRETLDPISYGYANPSSQLDGVNAQCSKSFAEGRMLARIPSAGGYCVVISFVGGDSIAGPMHTNDAFVFCGEPELGRGPADPIEVSGPSPGWFATGSVPNNSGSGCPTSGTKRILGTYQANSPVINPPPSNSALKSLAGLKFAGQVRICLNGNNMTASYGKTCTESPAYSGPIPASGVVYVESTNCTTVYSPFTATYPASSGCGNAFIRGNYSGQLTLATANDIIVDGNLIHSGEGVLGLIANNFVRVDHPFSSPETSTQTGRNECNGGSNGTGSVKDLRIDAAILAIDHSFIVDHYDCGSELGTLTVNGALAMKYRGPVGTTGGRGYIKDYNYDDRLRYLQPPHFIEPAESDWVVGGMTIE